MQAGGSQTLRLGCQNPTTRTSWISALAEAAQFAQQGKDLRTVRGCIGYLLVQAKAKGKWSKAFFTLTEGRLSLCTSKCIAVYGLAGDGASVALSSVQVRVEDSTSGKAFPCFVVALHDGRRTSHLMAKTEPVAQDWVTGIRAAISRNRYLALFAEAGGYGSALTEVDIAAAREDELVLATQMLTSARLAEQRAGAWAWASLSCNGANRLLMATPETKWTRELMRTALSLDEEISLECARAINNLCATPRVHSQILQDGVLETLYKVISTTPFGTTLAVAVRAVKSMLLFGGIPLSESERFSQLMHALKARLHDDSPTRALAKEIYKRLDKALAEAANASGALGAPAASAESTSAPPAGGPATPRRLREVENGTARAAGASGMSPLRSSISRMNTPPKSQLLEAVKAVAPASLDDSFERFLVSRAASAAVPTAVPMHVAPSANPFASPIRRSLI